MISSLEMPFSLPPRNESAAIQNQFTITSSACSTKTPRSRKQFQVAGYTCSAATTSQSQLTAPASQPNQKTVSVSTRRSNVLEEGVLEGGAGKTTA